MQRLSLALCGALCLFSNLFGQQPSRPKKILTPEQQAFQQQMREVGAQRDSMRAQAKLVFEAEMSREKAGDCPAAANTYEFNICYGKAVETTDENLKTYEETIRGLLNLKYPQAPDQPAMPGPAGPRPTPEQTVEEFDHVELLWHSYLDAASTAAWHQFEGGTGGPSFEMETHLRLVRGHMRELDSIYGMALHL